MASPARSPGKDKAAAWKANKERIGQLISSGWQVNQIEEELQKAGCRITSQLREWIIWEKRVPEVRDLLAQGLDVTAIEERMRLKGWIWTDNLKKKALWEFYREDIITHYKTLRSVEAVREIMVKKGFTPQTRIYYEWLRNWGISTSINRTSLSEMDAWSQPSPFGSNNSATPGSTIIPYGQLHDTYEGSLSGPSQSTLTSIAVTSSNNLFPSTSIHLHATISGKGKGHSNVHNAEPSSLNIDEDKELDPLGETVPSNPRSLGSAASSAYQLGAQVSGHSDQPNSYNTHSISAQDGSYWDDSDRSDEGEDDSNLVSTRDPRLVPFKSARKIETSSLNLGYSGDLLGIPSHQNDTLMSEKITLASGGHRTSSDSGYGSKTSSMQPIGLDYSSPLRQAGDVNRNLNQESNNHQWVVRNHHLHSLSCIESHQNIVLNCNYCGSSCLQEFALSALKMSPQQVYDCLCNYMTLQGIRHHDYAGNTFLHKLAIIGVPWEYIEAGLQANIDPCHRNAYGQTFAHVLNISQFQKNIIQCLTSLRRRGVDFNLRDASGRTILHSLYCQPMSPHTARQILSLIDESGRQLSLRDVYGRTPREILQHTFQQQASLNPRWSTTELQLQMLGIFEDLADGGILRLTGGSLDWPDVAKIPEELRAALQNQYQEVIVKAKNGTAVEAVDGGNAFHAQASLKTIHDAHTDLCSMEKFIQVGIDVNQYDKQGRTPLEALIIQQRDYETELTTSEKVSLLIDKGGANVYSHNRFGHTPLYSAAIRGLDRTVEALLLRGSHANIRANDGQSLLQAVVDAGHRAFMEYLESGRCQYHEAQCSRIEECKILLERYGAVLDPVLEQTMGYPARNTFIP